MTRPMPGPPECFTAGFPHEGAAINSPGCLLQARSYHANSKRLKDHECAKERDLVRQLREETVWSRLAAHTHALEES